MKTWHRRRIVEVFATDTINRPYKSAALLVGRVWYLYNGHKVKHNELMAVEVCGIRAEVRHYVFLDRSVINVSLVEDFDPGSRLICQDTIHIPLLHLT